MADALRYEEFRARLASECSVRYGDADATGPSLPAVLAEVGERREQQGFESFALLFHVENVEAPQQGSHVVRFADGTELDVFLVPIARDGARLVYEAVFNRATS
ncbi:MAG: hypothetical protein EOP90_12150 [Lysobacteraceae bacterium]|nr:MAG: hypothetical protein EOP90_12150 [Xanthomonadaceae bacterium]